MSDLVGPAIIVSVIGPSLLLVCWLIKGVCDAAEHERWL